LAFGSCFLDFKIDDEPKIKIAENRIVENRIAENKKDAC